MFSVERIQEWLVGLFFYFLFFYGFFFHFFTQIIRGFSLNILVGILKKNEKVSFVELKQLFDSGKGIEAVRHERVEVMKLAGTIRERNGRLELLRMGRFAVQMNRLLFVIFKFNYLGKSDG